MVGIDISVTALKLASRKAENGNTENCVCVGGTFVGLPFKGAYSDAAFSSYGIENSSLPGIEKASQNCIYLKARLIHSSKRLALQFPFSSSLSPISSVFRVLGL